jgi:hypothetical protein
MHKTGPRRRSIRRRPRTPIRRRGYIVPQDRLWFTEYRANKFGDVRTPKPRSSPNGEVPTPYSFPYDVIPDRKRRNSVRPACPTTAS